MKKGRLDIILSTFLLSLVLQNIKAMPKIKNRVGETYGTVTVISFSHSIDKKNYWNCECSCGNQLVISTHNLWPNVARNSCVKCNGKHHGMTKTTEWRSWRSMRNRCLNPDTEHFIWYGARGITICERWESFPNFLEDMGLKPSPKHTIDRIDVNGNYEPMNCRWATQKEQHNNKRSNHWLEFNGERKTIQQWLDITGMPDTTFHSRLKAGWSVEDALMKPTKYRSDRYTRKTQPV